MPQHLPDLDQRCPGSQHLGSRGVPQHMCVDRSNAGAMTRGADQRAGALDGQSPGWVVGADEQRPVTLNSAAAKDVLGDSLADIHGQR